MIMTGGKRAGRTQPARRAGVDEAVAKCLEEMGYRIVQRGYATPWARLDFIARDGPILAFVQVREAKRSKPSRAEREALARAAAEFLGRRGWWHLVCRFDAAVVRGGEIQVVKDAW